MVDSTQDVARTAVREGAEGPVLVVTHRQSSGRGRRGRRWVHTPGGLAFTLAIEAPPDAPSDKADSISLTPPQSKKARAGGALPRKAKPSLSR